MTTIWRPGFHAPKGVDAEEADKWIRSAEAAGREPSPENLYEDAKKKTNAFHADIWGEGDQVWAKRGRLERCRTILNSVVRVDVIGGKEISCRSVEFVKVNGDGRWASLEAIIASPDMADAHLAEIERALVSVTHKLGVFRELLKRSRK